jgi:protein PhnA
MNKAIDKLRMIGAMKTEMLACVSREIAYPVIRPDSNQFYKYYICEINCFIMGISKELAERCQGQCELCSDLPAVHEYTVSPKKEDQTENQVALCDTCLRSMDEKEKAGYWRVLEGSIWNQEPSVQALSYRILQNYREEDWVNNVLSSVELDENTIQWAMSAFNEIDMHKDAFGNTLQNGDTVILTQALNVKGTSFSAAKGTVVKRIRLVPDNTEQIEGKINEQTIVILAKYVKKG